MPSIGEALDRVDGRLKVTGRATYTADHNIPNLTHAVMVTSTIAKGRILSMNTRTAEAVPGVIAVLSYKSGLKLAKNPMEVTPGSPADRALSLLQDDLVHYANQPIGVVVATTLEAAKEGAEQIDIKYIEEKPNVQLEHLLPSSYIPKKAGGGSDPGQSHRGNPQQAFADSPERMQEIYWTQFQTHNPMEPHATIAVWTGPALLTIYDTSQGIFGDRKRIAELLGLKPENVRIVSLFLGGGFGSKGPTWSHNVLTAMAARHVGQPVKLVLRRNDMFGPVGFRSETRQTISIAASTDGMIAALQNDTASHTSTIDEFTEPATLPTRMLYSTPNNSTVQRLVRSDIGTPSYTRAPGEAPGTFALEVAMDEMAYRLKMDPLEFRLKNYAEKDEDKDLPWSTKSLRECYSKGAEMFRWSKRTPEPRSMKQGNKLIGWGMATSVYPARRSPASALARLNADGTVLVEAGSQDLGGGTYTIMTQIAADALGVPVSAVTFRLGDTRYPETPVSGGSQTAASCGSAVDQALKALRDKLYAVAAPRLQGASSADDLTLEKNFVRVKSNNTTQSLHDLFDGHPYIEAEASARPGSETKQYSMYSFGTQFAEVHVDADLGQIFVPRMVGVFAAGRILNAKTARSQFMGGMVWGIGLALYEDTLYDEHLGRIVNNNLAEYHVPTNSDVGSIEVAWIDEDDRHVSSIGAKGIGEIGITGAAAAIANAVYHATGVRVRKFPVTLDKLL